MNIATAIANAEARGFKVVGRRSSDSGNMVTTMTRGQASTLKIWESNGDQGVIYADGMLDHDRCDNMWEFIEPVTVTEDDVEAAIEIDGEYYASGARVIMMVFGTEQTGTVEKVENGMVYVIAIGQRLLYTFDEFLSNCVEILAPADEFTGFE